MTPIEKLQIALSNLREIRTSTPGLGGIEAIIKDVIYDLEKCEHPFASVMSKCNGEINKCLKCGEQL